MRDLLIANADKLAAADLPGYAKTLKLNVATFRSCLDSGRYKDAVAKDSKDADSLSISGTPSFVIGVSTPEGVDGVVFVGAQPFADFENKFKEAIVPKVP
jgi:protein-disulfide isomerase